MAQDLVRGIINRLLPSGKGTMSYRRSEFIRRARETGDILCAELPGYLTEEGRTPEELTEQFNEENGTSYSVKETRELLELLDAGNDNIHRETIDGEEYFSLVFK